MTMRGQACFLWAACLVATLLLGCGGPSPPPGLPPSASDLPLLQAGRICDTKPDILRSKPNFPSIGEPWGAGEEIRVRSRRGPTRAYESHFFDQDGLLVGYFILFPEGGLALKPYPVLRGTLSKLRPTVEFYQSMTNLPLGRQVDTTRLFMTGDVSSTTQYLVLGQEKSATLLAASMAIDPYFQLLSPYRQEFLARLTGSHAGESGTEKTARGQKDKDPFPALQQFARGETAHLEKFCGTRDETIAADAYRRAIAIGFSDKKILAEAHHKLGLALKGQGKLEPARDEMLESLKIVPSRPDVLNNLGEVYEALGDRQKARKVFEQAVMLKPNYAIARFNLAETYEGVDSRRAIEEYETYLALVEDIPEEARRAAKARERLKALGR